MQFGKRLRRCGVELRDASRLVPRQVVRKEPAGRQIEWELVVPGVLEVFVRGGMKSSAA